MWGRKHEELRKDWGERLQDKNKDNKLPLPKNRVPMPECKPPKKTDSQLDLLKELLNNPRVEGITISIEKVREVETIDINVNCKMFYRELDETDEQLRERITQK